MRSKVKHYFTKNEDYYLLFNKKIGNYLTTVP